MRKRERLNRALVKQYKRALFWAGLKRKRTGVNTYEVIKH